MSGCLLDLGILYQHNALLLKQVMHPPHWTVRAAAAASLFLCLWLLWHMEMPTWASRSSCRVRSAKWHSSGLGLVPGMRC